MQRKIPAILTLLGAVLAVGTLAMAAEIVDPYAEGVSAPYLIADSRVAPSYPPAAFAAKFEGVVNLKAIVNADGSVGAIEVLDSSRKSMGFEDAAIAAVSQWQFEPARKGEAVVGSYTEVRLRFNPPSSRSRGSVSSAFGGRSTTTSASATMASLMSTPKLGLASASVNNPGYRPAFIPVEFEKRLRTYGRPSGREGSIYDRRLLIPPGTGGNQTAAR